VDFDDEQKIIRRLGFIFEAYRVKVWWWESVEMGRKLIMTSLLTFIYPDHPAQLCVGALMTFFFLVVNMLYTPFVTSGLNSLQNKSLIAHFLTLFIGIMITLTADDVEISQEGQILLEVFLVSLNLTVLVWPLMRSFEQDFKAQKEAFNKHLKRCWNRHLKPCCWKRKNQNPLPPRVNRAPKTLLRLSYGRMSVIPSVEADVVVIDKDKWTKSSARILKGGVVRESPAQAASDVPEGWDDIIEELPVPQGAELSDVAPTPPARSADSIRRANARPHVYGERKDGIHINSERPESRLIKFHAGPALAKSVSFADGCVKGQDDADYPSDGKREARGKSGVGDDPSDQYLSFGPSTPSKHSIGAWLSSERQHGAIEAALESSTPVESTTPIESLPPSPRTAAIERMEQLEREFKDLSTVPLSAKNAQQGQQQGASDNKQDTEGKVNPAGLFEGAQFGTA
jgi:hypothetical protein